jgi:hypothetical protein
MIRTLREVAHEVILPFHSALDFSEKWLWVQLFQLFAAKTVIINIDGHPA